MPPAMSSVPEAGVSQPEYCRIPTTCFIVSCTAAHSMSRAVRLERSLPVLVARQWSASWCRQCCKALLRGDARVLAVAVAQR